MSYPDSRCLWMALLILLTLPQQIFAQLPGADPLARIGPREFILDQALLLRAEQRHEIQAICDKLLTDQRIPIIVVTVNSMRNFPDRPQEIEGFARSIFNDWGIGFAGEDQASWNRGILFVVAKQDRRARIELGADWARDQDAHCAWIMRELIIPYFKAGDYPGGILAGVRALDSMARQIKESPPAATGGNSAASSGHQKLHTPPPAPDPPDMTPRAVGTDSGIGGWFVFLVVIFVILRGVLAFLIPGFGGAYRRPYMGPGNAFRRMGRQTYWSGIPSGRSSGGSWGGGGFSSGGSSSGSSFGGGSSGGGGASGSW